MFDILLSLFFGFCFGISNDDFVLELFENDFKDFTDAQVV